MTLKEKYTIKNKKRIKQFIFLYSILVIFFVIYSTFAKYENRSEGYTKIAVANWNISLNGKLLTNNNATLVDSIKLIPTTGIDNIGTNSDGNNSIKIKPGQAGYFDIEIDPTDTEVSLWYRITLDLSNSNLPEGLSISSYSLNMGNTTIALPDDNTVSNEILLDGKDKLTNDDMQVIRYYWSWDEGDEGDAAYTIVINVELKQIL